MISLPTLSAAATLGLERALNHALELDAAGRKALMTALSEPVRFRMISSIPLSVTLVASEKAIQVQSTDETPAAVTISGRPMAFAALALGDDDVFRQGRVTVEGDVARAHQFQTALNQLNPDWEAALADYIGDVPAHLIGQRIRKAVRWSRQAFTSLNANLEEYIHEETGALPGRRELSATFREIDDLRLRTERLEARLNQTEGAART